MNAHDAIKLNLGGRDMVAVPYIEDLTDEQLMMRPHPDCNHINWQLGHLIASDHQMVEGVSPGSMPPLPEGFADKYTKERAKSDNPDDFHAKEELVSLLKTQGAATLAALDKLSEADLDKPAPESMQSYAPTIGAAFSLMGTHWLMHAGQWVIVRRQLGKPPLY
jgi:uncharacterized damage-inducible protein DinB